MDETVIVFLRTEMPEYNINGFHRRIFGLLDKVKKIIARHLEVDDKNIRLDTFLVNDLHASPAQIDGLIASMEKEFMIKIPQNDLYRFRKVKDIIDYLEARV